MANKVIDDGGVYYFARQQTDSRFVVDTSYPAIGTTAERYYFSIERLKEMITDKSFAIER